MRRAVGSDTSPQCSTPSARWSAQRGTDVLDERDAPRLRARRGVGGAHPRAPGVGARPPPARRVAGSRLHRECRRRNLRRAGVPRRDPGRCVPSDRGAHPRQHRSGASCTWKPAAKNALPSTRRRSSRPARRGRGSGSPALGNRPASSAHRAAHAREGEVDGDGATFLHLLAATACEERHWARSGRLDVSTRLRRHLRSVRRPNGVQAVPSSAVVLSTGARRSEALGRDVDFDGVRSRSAARSRRPTRPTARTEARRAAAQAPFRSAHIRDPGSRGRPQHPVRRRAAFRTLQRSRGTCSIRRSGLVSRRAQRDSLLGPYSTARAEARRASPQAPCGTTHVRDIGSRGGSQHSVCGRAARTRQPGTHAACVRACASRRRRRHGFRRLRSRFGH